MTNIKKIIREEIDDLDWIRDIVPTYDVNDPQPGMRFSIGDGSTIYTIKSIRDHGPYGKTMVISYWDDDENLENELKWDMAGYNWYHFRNQIKLVEENINESTEDDDFDWVREIKAKPNDPQPGTAWVILNIPNTEVDSIGVQKHLFNLGFSWPTVDKSVRHNYKIASIGVVWHDNIRDKTFTYTPHGRDKWDEGRWFDAAIKYSGEKTMDVFEWTGNKTIFVRELHV